MMPPILAVNIRQEANFGGAILRGAEHQGRVHAAETE